MIEFLSTRSYEEFLVRINNRIPSPASTIVPNPIRALGIHALERLWIGEEGRGDVGVLRFFAAGSEDEAPDPASVIKTSEGGKVADSSTLAGGLSYRDPFEEEYWMRKRPS